MTTDRRLQARARYTFGKYLKRWVELSTARKIAVAILVGGGASSATFAACNASDIAGPSTPTASAPRPSATVGGITELIPVKSLESEAVALANPNFQTSTKTIFPTTQVIHNPCMNETPILNGHIKVYEKLQLNGVTLKYDMHGWWDTRGVAATATAYHDDDGDPATPMKEYTVNYHNKQSDFDRFMWGPAGLPFQSYQESKIHLRREHDPRKTIVGGDDLFVHTSMRFMVDENGTHHEKLQYRTECH